MQTPGWQPRGVDFMDPRCLQAVQDLVRPLWERVFIQQLLVEEQAARGSISQALKACEQSHSHRLLPAEALWQALSSDRCILFKQFCAKEVLF